MVAVNERAALRLFGRNKPGRPVPITTIDEWFDAAPPKGGSSQWVPLRSAYQLAEAWCGSGTPAAPVEFLKMLEAQPLLHGLELLEGWAEHKTYLRGEQRGPRVHDLLLTGRCDAGTVVIGVEGKADEQFDRPLSERWKHAMESSTPTIWPTRLRRLVPALLGLEAEVDPGVLNPALADLPYQLLSALAGTLIEAEERDAQVAVLAVHVFTSTATHVERVEQNRAAFKAFIEQLASVPREEVLDDTLYGPFHVPGREGSRIPSNIPVLIGELTTELGR